MRKGPSVKSIKLIPVIFLCMVLANLVISISACVRSIGHTQILDVYSFNTGKKTYQIVEIGKNNFQTGTEGKLYWKIKNLKEAFLVALADRDKSTNFYDVFYLLILDIALFVMVFRIKDETVFSDQVLWGLRLIAGSVIFYPIINLMSYRLSSQCIEELTNGKFTAQLTKSNTFMFLIITYLLIFMAPFIKKAINLQKEQNLTI
jgi:hypothetical protein